MFIIHKILIVNYLCIKFFLNISVVGNRRKPYFTTLAENSCVLPAFFTQWSKSPFLYNNVSPDKPLKP
jgi:hypothetical protein